MKVLQTLPQNDLNEIPQAAKAAEEAGFDMVCTMENRHDPFLALGVAAVATEWGVVDIIRRKLEARRRRRLEDAIARATEAASTKALPTSAFATSTTFTFTTITVPAVPTSGKSTIP